MNFTGIIIAVCTFLTIGIWHPIVIKTEYYWGTKPWVIFGDRDSFDSCGIVYRKHYRLGGSGSFWGIGALGHW